MDTLDWMWNDLPGDLVQARFHLVQAFFGRYRSAARDAGLHPRETGPIVVRGPQDHGGRDEGHAVIGFGGMHVPFDEDLATGYAAWFLRETLPVLFDEHGAERVTVVGGHPDLPGFVPSRWARDPRLDVRPGLPRSEYAVLLRTAGQVLVAPGLTTLFECADGRLRPFLQPGFSMSMALQSHQVRATGYPHAATWPWLDSTARELASLPEAEGVALVGSRLRGSTRGTSADWLRAALRAYLKNEGDGGPLDLPVRPGLPPAVDAFRAAVRTGTGVRA